jgi:hypothetical protein
MQRESLSHEAAVEHFVAAVVAFSDDPGPANLERYLRASRSLEESPRSGNVSQRKRVTGGPRRVAQGGAAAA